jgi:hypothetical protein
VVLQIGVSVTIMSLTGPPASSGLTPPPTNRPADRPVGHPPDHLLMRNRSA